MAEQLMAQARAAGSKQDAQALEIRAERQLETAEPFAAQAAGSDGSWEPLQATLQEVGSVPTAALLPALRAQCPS